jgi:murein DD-endopeptidase MepM/ murein hydrolase activator NlpD
MVERMRMILGNKHVLIFMALAFIAVLQGIAISKDTYVPPAERPFLSLTQDFSFLKKGIVVKEPVLLSSVATVPPMASEIVDSGIRSLLEDSEDTSEASSGLDFMISASEDDGLLSAEDMVDLEELLGDTSGQKEEEAGATEQSGAASPGKQYLIHKVKRGETLASIARTYRMGLSQLVLFNNISDPDKIYPGYELKIDFEKEFTHVVKERESLWSIARLYNVEVSSLRSVNRLKDDILNVGDKLKIRIEDLSEENVRRILAAQNKKSRFISPLAGKITDKVGWRVHPITKRRHYHKGLDIAAPAGRPIRATDGGRVSFSGFVKGYGNLVIITHGSGYESRYGHCSKLLVKKGEKVTQGQLIARVGATGLATGPHVHFEIRRYKKVLDPQDFI